MKKKFVVLLLTMGLSIIPLTGCSFQIGFEKPIKEVIQENETASDNTDQEADNDSQTDLSSEISFKVETGDIIKVGISNGYSIKDKDNLFVVSKDGSEIFTGLFITSDIYDEYAALIPTNENVNFIENIASSSDSIVNSAYSYNNETGEEYDVLCWLNGSNTGFMIASMNVDTNTVRDAFKSLQVEALNDSEGVTKEALSASETAQNGTEDIEAPTETETVAQSVTDSDSVAEEDTSITVTKGSLEDAGFTVSYDCEFFTDYDNGSVTIRVNKEGIDSAIQDFLNGNSTIYYDTYDLSKLGDLPTNKGTVTIIEGKGNDVYRYFIVGDNVNAEISKNDGSQVTMDECSSYMAYFEK